MYYFCRHCRATGADGSAGLGPERSRSPWGDVTVTGGVSSSARSGYRRGMIETSTAAYRRHRFPVQLIGHVVWLYFRFSLTIRTQSTVLSRHWAITIGPRVVQRDDMADHQAALMHDEALDDELQNGLPVGKGGALQAIMDALGEGSQPSRPGHAVDRAEAVVFAAAPRLGAGWQAAVAGRTVPPG